MRLTLGSLSCVCMWFITFAIISGAEWSMFVKGLRKRDESSKQQPRRMASSDERTLLRVLRKKEIEAENESKQTCTHLITSMAADKHPCSRAIGTSQPSTASRKSAQGPRGRFAFFFRAFLVFPCVFVLALASDSDSGFGFADLASVAAALTHVHGTLNMPASSCRPDGNNGHGCV